MPVPSPGGSGGGGRKKRRRRPAAAPASSEPSDPENLFGGLDLGRAEHRDEKLCPNCAAVVDEEEDIECPECGVNIETGKLSEVRKAKKARGGPDPDEFYSVIWSNGWKFVTNHWGFVFKTGLTWGLCISMVILAAYVLNWFTHYRALELRESADAGVQFLEDGVLIEFDPGAGKTAKMNYDGVQYTPGSTRLINGKLKLPLPEVAVWMMPPTFFWGFIFLVFLLACGGWAWTLSGKVVEVTLAKQKKIKRFQGDVFGNMTKGFVTIFWPIVLMYPVIWIPGVMLALDVNPTVCLITFIVMFLIPYCLFLPIANAHMGQTYGYRSWLINWVMKDFFNTIGPTLFLSGIFFVTVLMIPLGICAGLAAYWDQFAEFYTTKVELAALGSMFGYSDTDAASAWSFAFYRLPFLFGICFLSLTFLFTLLAIPAIFVMRLFGLYTLYFRPDLSLCVEQVPLSNAGFGPRFLAIQVDGIICALICGVVVWLSGMLAGLIAHLYDNEAIAQYVYLGGIIFGSIIALGTYFSAWEAGSGRATLGKWAFGLLVLQEDNSPVTSKMAWQRFGLALLSVISISGTFTMCAFHPQNRALHDLGTNTKVVWRGDEDQ